MPIISSVPVTRISQREFSELSSEVMAHVFAIHKKFGRLFSEQIYKQELAVRMPGVALEIPIQVIHGNFTKQYFADVLVHSCGLFEFKATDALHSRHRALSIHYLLLFGLAHGKLVNVRGLRVEHEFVNCLRARPGLQSPAIDDANWDRHVLGAEVFHDLLLSLIHDWGCGLETALYTEAVVQLWGGEAQVCASLPVQGTNGPVGTLRVNLAAKDVAFSITTFNNGLDLYEKHAAKLVEHTGLHAMLWANIATDRVTFTTIR